MIDVKDRIAVDPIEIIEREIRHAVLAGEIPLVDNVRWKERSFIRMATPAEVFARVLAISVAVGEALLDVTATASAEIVLLLQLSLAVHRLMNVKDELLTGRCPFAIASAENPLAALQQKMILMRIDGNTIGKRQDFLR